MPLSKHDAEVLVNLIRDSFRVRENQNPIYIEVGDSFRRLSSAQHQVVFGRRGSGKSCLLVHLLRTCENGGPHNALYVGIDSIKKLHFPDILTRMLISIFEGLPAPKWNIARLWSKNPVEKTLADLRSLLDAAITSDVEQTHKRHRVGKASLPGTSLTLGVEATAGTDVKEQFKKQKLDYLERHLDDYRSAIKAALPKELHTLHVLVDDFYLVRRPEQPDVVDYLHRLLRGTNAYLKLGTIRHRTTLRRHEEQTIGVELGQDVEEISLDRTLETFKDTQDYLVSMLDELGRSAGIDNASSQLFNPGAAHALTLASGGVPRDFLNILADSIDLACRSGGSAWLTPKLIYKAAAQKTLPNKRSNLSEDAGVDAKRLEAAFADILKFCLQDKRQTAFLVSKEDAIKFSGENEIIQQLADFKLLHLIAPDTSAASGRPGRFSAYTLDAAIFMEPRRRGLDVVAFWEQDDERRPRGIRESRTYELSRMTIAIKDASKNEDVLSDVLSAVAEDAANDPAPDEETDTLVR
ncbi:hypothetical protein [Stenotrophomonas koreensis]|uniref:hypothetical protein n=1 Tax=Stenotrophomonas koreensis TaxID=266128 RepID=UPI000AE8460B|nr:hypothetical protein [Stenotrophomonas koreensis]